MPNDQPEQTRLSIVHQIYLIVLNGRLTKAPLPPDITRVLDVGSGPGDWALAMGEQYPDAEIIANDISIFDNDPGSVSPSNVSFQIDDAESEWTYRDTFDLIHFRGLSGAFADWSFIYRQAFTHLKPGGYIEIPDFDLAADVLRTPNTPTNPYSSIFVGAIRSAPDEAGYPHEGKINFVDTRIDPNTGSVWVRGVFANANKLLSPGLFVRVRVPVGDPHPAILIPERALGTDQGQKFVYVVNDKKEAIYREIRVGAQHGQLRIVEAGIEPGQRLVVSGLQRVRTGAPVEPKEEPPAPSNPPPTKSGAPATKE